MTFYFSTLPTPVGEFSVAVDESGSIAATAFGNSTALRRRLRVESLDQRTKFVAATTQTRAVAKQIREYFEGKRHGFDLVLRANGTAFQQRVWAELQRIPHGQTRSYGDLARTLRSSPRAVGRANATNPICLIVPCHRVIGADGSMTGFAFGESRKRQLLTHERAASIVAAI